MIPLSDVGGLGQQLGEAGGQGVVCESGHDPNVLVKTYLPGARIDPDGLQRLVDWPAGLSGAELMLINRFTSWPLAVVDLGNGAIGVTFRRAPDRYFHTVEGEHGPRKISWAFQAKECGWVGLSPLTPINAWTLLARIARVVEVLHRHGVAYRDFSNANIFFDATTDPTPFLIDCDSAHVLGAGPGVQGEPTTMGYQCPIPGLTGIELDVWKLTMLCTRVGLFFTGIVTADTRRLPVPAGRPASPEYVELHRQVMTGATPMPTASDLAVVCEAMVDGLRQRGLD